MEDGILPLWASFSQLLAWLITSSRVSGIKLCPKSIHMQQKTVTLTKIIKLRGMFLTRRLKKDVKTEDVPPKIILWTVLTCH